MDHFKNSWFVRVLDFCLNMNETDDLKQHVSFQDEQESRVITNEEENTKRKDQLSNVPVIQREGASSTERRADLENAMIWLRKELQEMKSQDKDLARQMISLRSKIKHMKAVGDSMADELYDSDAAESIDSGISTM